MHVAATKGLPFQPLGIPVRMHCALVLEHKGEIGSTSVQEMAYRPIRFSSRVVPQVAADNMNPSERLGEKEQASRIFLSHSSHDNALALALATWLRREGWGDSFLDIDAHGGITPGDRWQEALKSAAYRCESVVCLISPNWIASEHCRAEYWLAKHLGKRIFGVMVEWTSPASIPPAVTSEWQLCDLVNGEAREAWTVESDPLVPRTSGSFPVDGLSRLRHGLRKAGLHPSTFDWPPPGEPNRSPYRGLPPLDVQDSAIYFGRDSAIVRVFDELRLMHDDGIERLLVVLGASGSGKSSFIRAGMWQRLVRDDSHFIPLPVIRPQREAVTGDSGLIAAIEGALRRLGIARTRASIAEALDGSDGLAGLLGEIKQAAQRAAVGVPTDPSVVLLIDQGEELLATDGGKEALRFLKGTEHRHVSAVDG